jgi:carboxynorspermidine decarboxylase
LEPGEAVALDAGILVGEVLDTMNAEKHHALLDISATCHAPDVIEAPYRPALLGDLDDGEYKYFLGGSSCLTADCFGEYGLEKELKRGDRVAFLDQAHYTMVKTNTFNGVPLPSIALWNSKTDELSIIKKFGYEEFENRLS